MPSRSPARSRIRHVTVPRDVRIALALLVALTATPEILISLADAGLIGSHLWRSLSYQYGAFWAGLLHGWQSNFALQPATMFLSYSVLHVGMAHLIGNLAGLVWLGSQVGRRMGARGLGLVWAGSALGGGAVFGLMTTAATPMVGASGAVFGLAGAWVVQNWHEDRRRGLTRPAAARTALVAVALFVAANVISWVTEDGVLAWQAHLGGALAGAGLAALPVWRR